MGRPKKIIEPVVRLTFEEALPIIDECINRNKHKWTLSSLAFIEWLDVAQKLRFHIWKKYEQFDPTKGTLKSWLSRIIHNQLINCWRDLYFSHSRPCLRCQHYQGENLCALFGEVTTKCELYNHWYYGKRTKNHLVLALPMENHINEVESIQASNMDVERTSVHLHKRMKEVLPPLHWLVYEMLYIQKLDELDVAKKLRLKSNEARSPGYARINQLKKLILIQVKKVLQDGDVEIVGDNNV